MRPPGENDEDGEMEGNPEVELNAWLDMRQCLQREKLLGILSCAAFGGTTSAFLSSSLALLNFRRGHPPAVSFIIPILGWVGIGSGAHLALRNRTKFCLYMWPITLFATFSLMRYGTANILTSNALLLLLATANFFGCSLCACLLMHAEYVLPSLGPLLLYRHIPTISIMVSSMAGYYYDVFKPFEDLFSNSFKTDFEAKQESSSVLGYVYSDEVMGVSGIGAVGFFNGMSLGLICGLIMPCMWWLIFVLGSLVDYSSFLYRANVPQLEVLARRLPLAIQRCFLRRHPQQIALA